MSDGVKALYRKAWERWGDLQYIMVIEECAELQKVCTKYLRNKSCKGELAEEIADVEIMLEQLKEVKDLYNMVGQFKATKIERLSRLLEVSDE